MNELKIKRVYAPESEDDGYRILVDRLWPRGESKVKADLGEWAKQAAPSADLRKAFHSHSEDFEAFRKDYLAQLNASDEAKALKAEVLDKLKTGNVTLVYGSKDEHENNAVVLKDWIEQA